MRRSGTRSRRAFYEQRGILQPQGYGISGGVHWIYAVSYTHLESALFSNIVETQNVLMSHTDKVIELPSGNFRGIANTKLC